MSGIRLIRLVGLGLLVLGFFVFVLGADPAVYSLDRSPVTGFVQIAVFLLGLAMSTVGGYLMLNTLWNGKNKTISADIGLRLASTGYVICVAAGMADIFGIGTHPIPANIPYFGPIQAIGVIFGEIIIAVGFLLLIPYKKSNIQK